MSTFANHPIRYSRSQRRGLVLFILIFVLLQAGFLLLDQKSDPQEAQWPERLTSLTETEAAEKTGPESKLSEIDVNGMDKEGWMELGFSERQAETIIKYRYSLGGYFENTAQIEGCFVISEKKFKELEPYIQIRIPTTVSTKIDTFSTSGGKKPQIRYSKFNPNQYSAEDWQRIGFSEKQSATILKYKRSLGGFFSSLEEIEACYVISESKFQEMKPYIFFIKEEDLSEEPIAMKKEAEPISIVHESFNPNDLEHDDWVDKGFTTKQVQTILNYKNSLGGRFPDAETLKKCYVISEQKFSELEPYLIFD